VGLRDRSGEEVQNSEGRSRKRRRRGWIGLGVLLVLVFVLWYAMPTFGKLSRALDRVDLPSGSKLTETDRSGNAICFDTCPHLSRTYSVAGEPAAVEPALVASLRRAGYEVFMREPDDYRRSFALGKRYQIDWSVSEGSDGESVVDLTITQRMGE
jgi:hypothetical protein